MSRSMTASEAKGRLLALLDDAAAGEEIDITKHGRPVARLVPATGPKSLRGAFREVAASAGDDEALFSTGATWDLP